ncbi:MAG: hypothetical protein IT271_11050 [Chitinophagales bacterium]|nr:hypothetical protein [Chitinophagales bacterium]
MGKLKNIVLKMILKIKPGKKQSQKKDRGEELLRALNEGILKDHEKFEQEKNDLTSRYWKMKYLDALRKGQIRDDIRNCGTGLDPDDK